MLNLKRIDVKWKQTKKENIKHLIITVKDRVGLLADILNVISVANISIKSINSEPKKKYIQIHMKLDIKNDDTLKKLVNYIKSIQDVVGVNVLN